jgi:hypothetical protein
MASLPDVGEGGRTARPPVQGDVCGDTVEAPTVFAGTSTADRCDRNNESAGEAFETEPNKL